MPLVLLEINGSVAVVTLNRPDKHNALNAEMMVRLAETWDQIAQDDTVKVALLTGAGGRAFCAGADLTSLVPLATGAREPETVFEQRWVNDHQAVVDGALLRNTRFIKPVVAAVRGLAVAAGFELMLGTDIRVASTQSTFQLSEVKHGLIPSGGSLARLPRQIGWANAMEIILAGASIEAERALAFGLINRVVAAEDVLAVAREFCDRIAEAGPLAVAKAKEAMLNCSGRDLNEAFAIEQACQAVIMASADAREGALAFTEKRDPRFLGR